MITTDSIFNIKTQSEFESACMEVFKFQFENNRVYRSFCDLLYIHSSDCKSIQDIPFLPIEFFKSHDILSSSEPVEQVFTSSGTTRTVTSKHQVTNIKIYEESFRRAFSHFYGSIEDYVVLALLPSYLEREGSSLIYMVEDFIKQSCHPESGFYLNNLSELKEILINLDAQGKKILLIGVSFALLDLVESYQFELKNTVIMETGGMKGRRKELVREELHTILKQGFGVEEIHSEYGMTELLSQAYSLGEGVFECPNWMQIIIRDPEDALTILPKNKTGGINVIDLANINSCAFIATQDLGKTLTDNRFEIIGRFDNSDIRGCNLLVL